MSLAEIRRRKALGLSRDDEMDLFSGRPKAVRQMEAEARSKPRRSGKQLTDDGGSGLAQPNSVLRVPSKGAGGANASQDRWHVISTPKGTTRPRSASGGTSFHFSRELIRKGDDKADPIHHDSYVEREQAVEICKLRLPIDDAYILRDGAAELADQDQGETSGTLNDDRLLRLVWSNIGANSERRASYWEAAIRWATTPSTNANVRLHLAKLHACAFEDSAIASALPPVREALIIARDLISQASEVERASLEPMVIGIDPENADKVMAWSSATFKSVRAQSWGLTVNKPRAGIIQHRLIAELPHELDAAGRARATVAFLEHLEGFGLMYTAAVHAPDVDNDNRNFHLHVNIGDQPGKWLEAEEAWDFAYLDPDKSTEARPVRPYRRKKIDHPMRDVKGEKHKSGRQFIWYLRCTFADCVNVELAAAESDRHYDPRSHEDMGVDRPPQKHLGPAKSRLVARGEIVNTDVDNAHKYYSAEERRIQRVCDEAIASHQKLAATATAQLSPLVRDGRSVEVQRACKALADFVTAGPALANATAEVELLRLMSQRALSRSATVVADCDRILAPRSHLPSKVSRKTREIEQRRQEALEARSRIEASIAVGQQAADRATHNLIVNKLAVDFFVAEMPRILAAASASPAKRQERADEDRLVNKPSRGTGWNGYEEYTRDVLEDVAKRRVRIAETRRQGVPFYLVPELVWTDADAALGENQDYAQRRLASLYQNQRRELTRLESWFEKHHRDPALMSESGEIEKTLMPKAVRTLFGHYENYPDIMLLRADMMVARRVGSPRMLQEAAKRSRELPGDVHPDAARLERNFLQAEAQRVADEKAAAVEAQQKADREAAEAKASEDKALADAEARRLAAEAEVHRLVAIEAKRVADEQAAKAKAAEDKALADAEVKRLAAEAEAQRLAVVEATRVADEQAVKAKAAEDQALADAEAKRLAAEAEAKRLVAIEAKRVADEQAEKAKAAEDQALADAEAKQRHAAAAEAERVAAIKGLQLAYRQAAEANAIKGEAPTAGDAPTKPAPAVQAVPLVPLQQNDATVIAVETGAALGTERTDNISDVNPEENERDRRQQKERDEQISRGLIEHHESRMAESVALGGSRWFGLRKLPGRQVDGRRLFSQVLLHNDARLLLEGRRTDDHSVRRQGDSHREAGPTPGLKPEKAPAVRPSPTSLPAMAEKAAPPAKPLPQPAKAHTPAERRPDPAPRPENGVTKSPEPEFDAAAFAAEMAARFRGKSR